MIQNLRELYLYRELLLMIVWRDIKVRYKQSLMGFMWAILMPMLIVCAGILVRYAIAVISTKPLLFSDIASVSVKALPWSFFVGSVRFGTESLRKDTNLVTKIYFPKEIFPISAVLSSFVDFIVASCLLVVILMIFQIGFSVYLLWVPILILLLILMVTGLSLILSALNLYFRDVKYLVEVVMTFAIFFTPVLYDVAMFDKWRNILLLNPMAPILEGISACVVMHGPPHAGWLTYSAVVSCLILGFDYPIFKKLECRFAESI